MAERNDNLRRYIFKELESGRLRGGDIFPSARKLAQQFGMSLSQVQMVLNSLMQDGIIEAKPRSRSYVQENWLERIPQAMLSIPTDVKTYQQVSELLNREHPELYVTKIVPNTTFEIRFSHQFLCKHDEYMDLMPIFRELFGNGREFFTEQLKPFIVDGKLCGIPVIFSPRLLVFNRRVLERYNAPIPQENWNWDDFLNLVKYLTKYIPGNQIFDWGNFIHHWINIVSGSNGKLFSSNSLDTVCIDSDATILGLKRHVELRDLLNIDFANYHENLDSRTQFANGDIAMCITALPFLNEIFQGEIDSSDFGAVSIPVPIGGNNHSVMAADLFGVRKSCSDIELAKSLIKLLLSPNVQNIFAQNNYCVPFRRDSALQKFKDNNSITARYMAEVPKLHSMYNIYSPELYQLVCSGIEKIVLLPASEVEEEIRQLATAVRVFLKYYVKNDNVPLEDLNILLNNRRRIS